MNNDDVITVYAKIARGGYASSYAGARVAHSTNRSVCWPELREREAFLRDTDGMFQLRAFLKSYDAVMSVIVVRTEKCYAPGTVEVWVADDGGTNTTKRMLREVWSANMGYGMLYRTPVVGGSMRAGLPTQHRATVERCNAALRCRADYVRELQSLRCGAFTREGALHVLALPPVTQGAAGAMPAPDEALGYCVADALRPATDAASVARSLQGLIDTEQITLNEATAIARLSPALNRLSAMFPKEKTA